jgi:hypothetical protein
MAVAYLPNGEDGPKVTGDGTFQSREAAVAACIAEIENGLERSRHAPRFSLTKLCSMTDLAEMIDATLPEPGKSGPYEKQIAANLGWRKPQVL